MLYSRGKFGDILLILVVMILVRINSGSKLNDGLFLRRALIVLSTYPRMSINGIKVFRVTIVM
jgi:hypothetical protein